MYKLLSYPLYNGNPGWPGMPSVETEPFNSMTAGSFCNTFMVKFFNHTGTHFDAPNHYVSDGKKISDLSLDRFIFEKPLIVDILKKDSEKVSDEDLMPYSSQMAKADALLIRTGFSKVRNSDIKRYENKNPGIGSSAAKYLIQNFPGIKAVGIDSVSATCVTDTTDGNLAHDYLLGKHSENFICIIEDCNFEGIENDKLIRVFAVPLMFRDIDSCPVTIIAEIQD